MAVDPNAKALVARLVSQGATLDRIIGDLRAAGYSKGQSVVAIAETQGSELGEITQAVHESPTWADRRQGDAAANRAFWDELAAEGKEQLDGTVDLTHLLRQSADTER